jgi:hypothetical protein
MIIRSVENVEEYLPECKTLKILRHANIVVCEKYWIEPVVFTYLEELAMEIGKDKDSDMQIAHCMNLCNLSKIALKVVVAGVRVRI